MSRVFPALSMFYGSEIAAKHAMLCISHLKKEDTVRIAVVRKTNGKLRTDRNKILILAKNYFKNPEQFQCTPFNSYYDNFSLFEGIIFKDIKDSFLIAAPDDIDVIPFYSYGRMSSGKLATGSEFKSDNDILRKIHTKWSYSGYRGGLNIIQFEMINSNMFITHIIKGHQSK